LRTRRVDASGLLAPELLGTRYGSLEIISRAAQGSSSHLKVEVRCDRCKETHFALFNNIRKRPKTAACPHCNGRTPVTVPMWLYQRCQGQLQRCRNHNAAAWERYGGRGIEFRFGSVNEAATWVAENLGIPGRTMQLDRIDNDGHYEPGNLHWATTVENQNNTRVSGGRARFVAFRKNFPLVRYADSTLSRMLNSKMTDAEIVHQWLVHSNKPKGKYGTCSMLGPYRGSLPTDA
jgi:hypothetical protein